MITAETGVYLQFFDEGESFAEIFERFGKTPLVDAVRPSDYPLPGGGTAVELSIAPELYRFSFERAGSTLTEVDGASHFVMLSKPDIVAAVIREAAMASAATPVA